MELRDSRYVVHEGCDHIFFVGFLGAGKSTLARNLGELFHRRYVDTDRLAERIAGKSLAEIYEDDGEELFRQAETEVLHTLKSKKSLLVSCGGGIVEKDVNLALMREMGVVKFSARIGVPIWEALKTLLSSIDACVHVMRPLLILQLIFARKHLSR